MSSRLKRKIPAFGAALLAVMAIGAIGASGASALSFSGEGQGVSTFTVLGNQSFFSARTTGYDMRCEKTSGSGQFNSRIEGTEGLVQLYFEGCHETYQFGFHCTTAGQVAGSGNIVTPVLSFKLVYLDAAKTEFGMLISPQQPGGLFAECDMASNHRTITGSVLAKITSPAFNVSTGTSTVSLTQYSDGIQTFEQIEGAGTKYHLSMRPWATAEYEPTSFVNEWSLVHNQKGKYLP